MEVSGFLQKCHHGDVAVGGCHLGIPFEVEFTSTNYVYYDGVNRFLGRSSTNFSNCRNHEVETSSLEFGINRNQL